jgi:EmrB/QacA subfamily drug resistance transporter
LSEAVKEAVEERGFATEHERLTTGQAVVEAASEHHGVDRRMVTFFGIMAAIFLGALDQTVVGTALYRVAAQLHGLDRYTWVVTVYMLTSTAVVPVVGKLSEQLGRKRVFLTGIVAFLLGSALCGLAQDWTQLVAFRGFQGIGAGILTGTAFAVIADLFSPAERAKYTGMVTAMFGLASVVGPLVGGWLTDNASWRWVFYVNLPIGAIVLAALVITFPSLRHEGAHPRIDYLGALGVGGGAALLTLGASLAGTHDWTYPPVWILLLAGAMVLIGAILYEARTPEAVLPPQLFNSSIVSVSMAVTFITGVAMFGGITFIPLFLQGIVGVKATNSGLLLLPMMAGMMAGSIGGGFVLSRTGKYKVQAAVGMAFMAVSMYLLTRLTAASGQFEVSLDTVFMGLGLGLSMPVFNVVSQNAVQAKYISSATSALQFVRQIGGVLGLAVLGALESQQLRAAIPSRVPASALSRLPGALRAAVTDPNQLFGGGISAIVDHLPAGTRAQVAGQLARAMPAIVHGMRLAFADAIHTVFVFSLGMMLVAFVLTFFIREIPLRKTTALQERAAARAAAAG